jgi:hypothetical protein
MNLNLMIEKTNLQIYQYFLHLRYFDALDLHCMLPDFISTSFLTH